MSGRVVALAVLSACVGYLFWWLAFVSTADWKRERCIWRHMYQRAAQAECISKIWGLPR